VTYDLVGRIILVVVISETSGSHI